MSVLWWLLQWEKSSNSSFSFPLICIFAPGTHFFLQECTNGLFFLLFQLKPFFCWSCNSILIFSMKYTAQKNKIKGGTIWKKHIRSQFFKKKLNIYTEFQQWNFARISLEHHKMIQMASWGIFSHYWASLSSWRVGGATCWHQMDQNIISQICSVRFRSFVVRVSQWYQFFHPPGSSLMLLAHKARHCHSPRRTQDSLNQRWVWQRFQGLHPDTCKNWHVG